MLKISLTILALATALCAVPVRAGDNARKPHVATEATVKMISDLTYTEILRQAWRKGWRYTPEQLESGYSRHLEEFKLRLIGQGVIVVSGDVGT
jgi:hypothetical protein